MRNGGGISNPYAVEQIRRVQRRRAVVDVRLVIHDRHLIIIRRLHHPRQLGDARIDVVGERRRGARAAPGRDQQDAVGGAVSVNRCRRVFQHADRFDIGGIEQVEVAGHAIDQDQRRVPAIG